MSSFPGSWALCGGWAVDAWLGHPTREHKDVDVAIFEEDLPLVAGHFADWRLIAHDETEQDSEDPWDGRWLILPAHIHVRRPGDIDLELLINDRPDGQWVLSREPDIRRDLAACISMSDWGPPVLTPEVVLFYKAQHLRPQDEADLRALLPVLTNEQVAWLRTALALVRPGHPWLGDLPRHG